ncbi:MAG: MvdC/MvdD family ATP grasp protein [Pseudonocardia sp.]
MTVLVLASDLDPTADAVVAALATRDVSFFRADLRDYPTRVRLDGNLIEGRLSATLSSGARGVELGEIRSIWNRNPSACVLPAAPTAPEHDLARRDVTLGLGDALASLDVLWVNHPSRCTDETEPYRRTVAAECGLDVADTSVAALGPVGVRLTIIGERWFPIAIRARDTSALIDWRSDPSAFTYNFVPIPDTVVTGVSEYLRRTRMAYIAVDFVVTPDDRWVMVEADSSPQFACLAAATGAPMILAMADLLMAGAG